MVSGELVYGVEMAVIIWCCFCFGVGDDVLMVMQKSS